jgi:hypothetical protein
LGNNWARNPAAYAARLAEGFLPAARRKKHAGQKKEYSGGILVEMGRRLC